ncbi:IS1380 family transposase [candidate division KSB1 bacterium]|nr:IS1380 family transposase [candidate division KSB1 bacterium]
MAKKDVSKQAKITKIDVTREKLSGRGGIFFFLTYVENIIFYALFEKYFGFLRKSAKGLSIYQFIKQLLAHFVNGTDMSMSSFNRRKGDESYAAILENVPEQMASSHQMKRVFSKLAYVGNRVYRSLLHQLFIWRLKIEKPAIIILFADTMVLDNDDADKREGVEPTYKKKKGFQPFHICWGPYLVDVIFRNGSVHSNHGSDMIKAVAHLTHLIRKKYSDVPIILLSDSGFLDDANFRYFEERLKIHYICAGKQYDDLKQYVQLIPPQEFRPLLKGNQSWQFIEFGNRLKSWSKFRRCLFTTLETEEDGQLNLEFAKTDSFIYTNLGTDKELTEKLIRAGGQHYLTPEAIIELNHQRGKGELTNRSIKEFATKEQLPFERFGMNRAYYYFLVISHFLYEAFKRDALEDVIPVTCYPNTFRRRIIDFAAKIVATGGHIILKVTETVFEHLQLKLLWQRVKIPEPIPLT